MDEEIQDEQLERRDEDEGEVEGYMDKKRAEADEPEGTEREMWKHT